MVHAYAEPMAIALPAPQSIDTAPTDAAMTLLVYCPDLEAGLGRILGAKWLDSATLSRELQPTHRTAVPGDPYDLAVES